MQIKILADLCFMVNPPKPPTNFIFVAKRIAKEEEHDYDDHTNYETID